MGSSSRRLRSRAATGATIFRATDKNPEWQELDGSSRKPVGEVGAARTFTAQSRKLCVPRMAKTIVFMSSIGSDLTTMALVPCIQSESTYECRSRPEGLS